MKLYIKEVKYDLWEERPLYGITNGDDTYDHLVQTTGWITEEEEETRYEHRCPFQTTKDQWITREKRFTEYTGKAE